MTQMLATMSSNENVFYTLLLMAAIGFGAYLLTAFVEMPAVIKKIIIGFAAVFVFFLGLRALGVL